MGSLDFEASQWVQRKQMKQCEWTVNTLQCSREG